MSILGRMWKQRVLAFDQGQVGPKKLPRLEPEHRCILASWRIGHMFKKVSNCPSLPLRTDSKLLQAFALMAPLSEQVQSLYGLIGEGPE